jgi:N-acetylneuraminic acid mutarotase
VTVVPAAGPRSWAPLIALAVAGVACDGSAGMAPTGAANPDAAAPEPPAARPVSEGHWEARADMPGPTRTYPGVAAVGSRVFVVGGFSRPLGSTTTTVYDTVTAYDTDTGKWEMLDPLPKPITGVNLAGVGGKLYVLGGFDVRESYEYDLAARRWSPKSPVPVTRGHGVAAIGLLGTKILLAGGAQPGQSANNLNTGVRVGDVLSYDTATDQWERLPAMDVPRGYAMGAVLANSFWVIGGSSDFTRTDEVIALDLTTRVWREGPKPPVTVSSAGVGVLGGRIYVVGGVITGSGAIGPLTLVLDPVAGAWDSGAPLNTPRFATGAAAIGGKIYFPGGVALVTAPGGFAAVPTLEVFIP